MIATLTTLGVLLAQPDDNKKEIAIYDISPTLVGYELNYSLMEKDYLAMVFATKKLCQYLLSLILNLISKVE